MCESLLVCVCVSEGYPHQAFSRSVYSCKSFQTITFADIQPQKPREKQREIQLTGTVAIKVGRRTLMSPLLPFFILVDYKVKIMKRNVLIHLNTVAKNKKLSQHCTFFHYVLLLLEHFPLTIFDIQCLIVTSLCWLCCNYRAVPYCDIILKKNVVETLTNC